MKEIFKKNLSKYLLVFIDDILVYDNDRNVLVILIMNHNFKTWIML